MTETPAGIERSYGCENGDGNPMDYIVVSILGGDVMMLCTPCFVKTAADMVKAFLEPNSPEVALAWGAVGLELTDQPPGPRPRRRGHNAPAEIDDASIINAYDDRVLESELPDEFR